MRIKVYETSDRFKVYPSMKTAIDAIGKKKFKELVKANKVERFYEKGHWNDVSEDWLKEIGRRHKDVGFCLIQD